jgi:hypothetical protein
MDELRRAAWSLLLPFTDRAEGLPDPAKWVPGRSIFSNQQAGPGGLPLEIDLIPPDPAVSVPPDRFESTFFNKTAQRFIEGAALNKKSTTRQLQRQFLREVVFPPGSMAIKAFWYRIRPNEKIDVSLWDWRRLQQVEGTRLPPDTFEEQCVEISPSDAKCISAKDNFYTATVDDPLLFCGPGCARPNRGDLMILVGLHIISKVTPEWLWATYWWRGPDQTDLHGDFWTCQWAQRPDAIGSKARQWLNYSMTATASFRGAAPLPLTDDDKRCGYPGPIIDHQEYLATYNPFVEARFTNGLKSSCVNCHARADTNDENGEPAVPGPLDKTSPFLRSFEGHIRTDYLWSLRRGLEFTHWPPSHPK